jgi:hypothetical protein
MRPSVPHGNPGFAEVVDLFLKGRPPKLDIATASGLEILAACVEYFNYIFCAGQVTNEDVKCIKIFPVDEKFQKFNWTLNLHQFARADLKRTRLGFLI